MNAKYLRSSLASAGRHLSRYGLWIANPRVMTQEPTNAEAHRIFRQAVAAAVMAPSSHNTQPWRFRIVGSLLEVHMDTRRHLSVIDRERRQLVQSCGCALFNARVAIRAMGYADELAVMPDDANPDLVATIHLGGRIISAESDLALMRALPLRRTNRRPFQPRPVSAIDAGLLAESAKLQGAWMERLHPTQKTKIAALIDEADQLQYGDPAFRRELAHWLGSVASRRRDGIPFVEKEYGSKLPFGVIRALRSPGLGESFGALEEELVNGAPIVAVIGTDSDDPGAWLSSGQALEAVLLHATHLGLSAAFLNQVLELPELRGRVAELLERSGYPQMVLRLGYPDAPVLHAAPRRALDDVLLVVE